MSYTCLNVAVCAPALGLFNALCHQGLVRLEGKKKKKGICSYSWEVLLLNTMLRWSNPHIGLFPLDYCFSWHTPRCTERALHRKASFTLGDLISPGPFSPGRDRWGLSSKLLWGPFPCALKCCVILRHSFWDSGVQNTCSTGRTQPDRAVVS